jgi:hypothetical protein
MIPAHLLSRGRHAGWQCRDAPLGNIAAVLQHQHEQFVWDRLLGELRGWQTGAYRDHDVERIARRLGIRIRPPAFLVELIEKLDETKPPGSWRPEG